MTQDEIEQFAKTSKPKRRDKITRLLYSTDKSSINLACVALLGNGKLYCEKYLDYCSKEYFMLSWGAPILIIDKKINIAILIIDWMSSNKRFPKRTCHLVPEKLCRKIGELTRNWQGPTIIEI